MKNLEQKLEKPSFMANLKEEIGKRTLLYTAAAMLAVGGLARCESGEKMESCYTSDQSKDFCRNYIHGVSHGSNCDSYEICECKKPEGAPNSECECHCKHTYQEPHGYK